MKELYNQKKKKFHLKSDLFTFYEVPLYNNLIRFSNKQITFALAGVGHCLVWAGAGIGALSNKPKCGGFVSSSGHMPRLWVQSLVGARMRGN